MLGCLTVSDFVPLGILIVPRASQTIDVFGLWCTVGNSCGYLNLAIARVIQNSRARFAGPFSSHAMFLLAFCVVYCVVVGRTLHC